MKLSHLALVVVLSAVTAFAATKVASPTSQTAQTKETAYERVMRTGTLRCGYLFYPEFFAQDVNTKKFSGFYYDVMEEIGRRLSLKIEWAEEVGAASSFEGLKTSRYDTVCVPYAALPERALATEFTNPIIYVPYFAYARADDMRFDNNLSKINDPSVKMVVLDGEIGQTVQRDDFPNASLLTLPNFTDASQLPLYVAMGKADVFMSEPSTAQTFIDKNPGKIKRIAAPPIRMQASGITVGIGEDALKSLLNTTIDSLHSTGFIERLFIKSEKDKDFYFLPAQPWRRAGE